MTPLRLSIAALATAAACAAAEAAPLALTVLDAAGQPLHDVAVAVFVHGVAERTSTAPTVELAQRDKRFLPSLLVVQTGTAVRFPNLDTVRHHVYSFSPAKTFEIKLYVGTPAHPVLFDKPGTAVLGCNIHDKMQGYVHVVDTPHHARTDAAGHATLELPEGRHELQLWHPRLPIDAPQRRSLHTGAAASALILTLKGDP